MTDTSYPVNLDLPRKLRDKAYRLAFFWAETSAKIAEQLIALRKRRGLNQTQVAGLLHTKQPAISRVEKADYQNWNVNTLRSYAEALDARVRVLIEPSEDVIGEYETDQSIDEIAGEAAAAYFPLSGVVGWAGFLAGSPLTLSAENAILVPATNALLNWRPIQPSVDVGTAIGLSQNAETAIDLTGFVPAPYGSSGLAERERRVAERERQLAERERKLAEDKAEKSDPQHTPELPPAYVIYNRNSLLNIGT
jgi:transcriptional regulator with XRE-family HTH domain